jgi:hypothetical protein
MDFLRKVTEIVEEESAQSKSQNNSQRQISRRQQVSFPLEKMASTPTQNERAQKEPNSISKLLNQSSINSTPYTSKEKEALNQAPQKINIKPTNKNTGYSFFRKGRKTTVIESKIEDSELEQNDLTSIKESVLDIKQLERLERPSSPFFGLREPSHFVESNFSNDAPSRVRSSRQNLMMDLENLKRKTQVVQNEKKKLGSGILLKTFNRFQ